MPKHRLLFVADFGTDIRLITRLSQDYQLTILTKDTWTKGTTIQRMKERNLDVRLITLPDSRLIFLLEVFWTLLRIGHQFDVVLVLSNSLTALSVNLAKLIIKFPVILYVGSPTVAYATRKYKDKNIVFLYFIKFLVKNLVSLNSKLCDLNVALGQYLAEIIKKYSENTENAVNYGVDTSLYAPVSLREKSCLRTKLGLPQDVYLIISPGTVYFYKDPISLLRAVKVVRDKGYNVMVLHLSGQYEQFVKLADRIGIGNVVIARKAVDPTSKLQLFYQASDLCIQSSFEEGLGMCVLEALSCQTPVIGTRVGGMQYTILHKRTGLAVPRSDFQKLAQAIEFAMDNPDEMKRMAEDGRRMVQKKYESEKQAKKLNKLIERVINKSKVIP